MPRPRSPSQPTRRFVAQLHPGYDCVVATRAALTRALPMLGDVFLGFPPVGALLAEALAHADPGCVTARNAALTFHLGARNGGWGVRGGVGGGGGGGAANGSREDDERARLMALNQRLARQARDKAAAAVAAGVPRAPGARCREVRQLPEECTAARHYPPPGGGTALKMVWA